MKCKSLTNKAVDLQKVGGGASEDYPWKVLSKLSLDLTEYLTADELKRVTNIARYRDMDAYLELAEEWGLQSTVPADTSTAKLRAKYLLASLIKKYRFPTDQKIRIARATEIFLEAEGKCKTYNELSYKELAVYNGNSWSAEILFYAREFLVKLLGNRLPGSQALLDRSRHGPGSTIGTDGGDVSIYHKYENWPYSCTKNALRYARFAIETDRRWLGALQDSYRDRFKIPKQYPLNLDLFWARVINVVDGNRIAFVPKDARKERTIAIEPALNLYLQLGVDGFIRKRLKRYGVNLDDQKKNQELARQGSLNDGQEGFVTIDLSAASDSISLKLCELLLPFEWYAYLCDLRCPFGTIGGGSSRKQLIVYEKISSMGNGFTFALESALFAAFVYAVHKADGVPLKHEEFAVYGDDIIVKKRWYFKLVEALRLAGFTVNAEKTFVYGPIRESCGADWFHGAPVRPVLLTEKPASTTELFCDFNRIKRLLSLRWDIPEVESESLDFIRCLIPERARLLIGPYSDEDFDSYLHTDFPRKGMYKRCMYKYRRFVIKPMRRPGRNFLFRKLMHDLRGKPLTPNKWEKSLTAVGSRFTVTRRNANTVGYAYSISDIWRNEYEEL